MAALFGASCGGVSFSARGASSTTTAALTRDEYVARANAVCATGNAQIDGIGDPGSDPSKQAQAIDAETVIIADELRELRGLAAPSGDAATVARIYAEADKMLKDAAPLSAALRAGDQAAAQRLAQALDTDTAAANAAADAYGLTVCASDSPSDSPPPQSDPTTLPEQPFPTLEVRPGVNDSTSGPFKPLFEIRGTGSRTSPPLALSTTCLSGGVDNDGWVKVTIAPAKPTTGNTAIPYYTNSAGSGGASATLPRPGEYVVTVDAINPQVHWTVDIADKSSVYHC